jgi:hypothetical protein
MFSSIHHHKKCPKHLQTWSSEGKEVADPNVHNATRTLDFDLVKNRIFYQDCCTYSSISSSKLPIFLYYPFHNIYEYFLSKGDHPYLYGLYELLTLYSHLLQLS